MGIKYLNRYLKNNCKKGIENISIDKLRGKTIVIDTSIYIYKFLEENALLENFFVLITSFREYEITPLFILDGKADVSKMDLLWKRVHKKRDALKEFHVLKERIEAGGVRSLCEKKQLLGKMEALRKKSTRIQEQDLAELKQLFDAMGVFYHTAEKEADIVCAHFVKKGLAWGCMSDDMDMFVYGCDIVLREWNMKQSTGMLYRLDTIMKEVRVEPEHFSRLLLLMGSDYNQEKENVNVYTAFKWYDEYMAVAANDDVGFYLWLQNTQKISSENAVKLDTIFNNMYNSFPTTIYFQPSPLTVVNWREIKKLMAPYGFVIAMTSETTQ